MKLNMNNKYEYTRCILPYIGALAPVEEEEAADKKLTECIKSMKAKYKKKGIRLIEGTRMHNFPEGSPFELVPEFLRTEEEERALREEDEKEKSRYNQFAKGIKQISELLGVSDFALDDFLGEQNQPKTDITDETKDAPETVQVEEKPNEKQNYPINSAN